MLKFVNIFKSHLGAHLILKAIDSGPTLFWSLQRKLILACAICHCGGYTQHSMCVILQGSIQRSTKRIKDEIFCFAHLRWCHDGWASNIYPPRLKYWMAIHYDTIKDGQNKCRIVSFLDFIGGIYLSKILLHHFIGFIWIITPLWK